MNLNNTQELYTRKVSMTKIYGSHKAGSILIGWESSPPREGEPYRIHMEGGLVLSTSPVESVTETSDVLTIKTANSLYEVKIIEVH